MKMFHFCDGLFLRGGLLLGSRVVQMSLDIQEHLFLEGMAMTGGLKRPKSTERQGGMTGCQGCIHDVSCSTDLWTNGKKQTY